MPRGLLTVGDQSQRARYGRRSRRANPDSWGMVDRSERVDAAEAPGTAEASGTPGPPRTTEPPSTGPQQTTGPQSPAGPQRHRSRTPRHQTRRPASRPGLLVAGPRAGRPAPDPARGLPGRGRRGHLAAGHVRDRAAPARRAGRGRLRLGPVVDRASGRAPGQPVVHRPHGRPGRDPARLHHDDAAGRADHDPGHPGVRPGGLVQRGRDPAARAALLRDVPGRPALAAHPRRDRRRGAVRPVLDADLAGLVPPQHRGRNPVPAHDPRGRDQAAAAPRPAPGGDPGPGARRQRAGQPGVGGAGRADGRGGPAALAGQPPDGRPGPVPGPGRGGGRRRGQPAAHRHGPAGADRRREHHRGQAGHELRHVRRRAARPVRALAAAEPLRAAPAGGHLPVPRAQRGARHVRPDC